MHIYRHFAASERAFEGISAGLCVGVAQQPIVARYRAFTIEPMALDYIFGIRAIAQLIRAAKERRWAYVFAALAVSIAIGRLRTWRERSRAAKRPQRA